RRARRGNGATAGPGTVVRLCMIFRGGIAGRAALTGDHSSAAPRYRQGRLARRRAAPGRVPRRPRADPGPDLRGHGFDEGCLLPPFRLGAEVPYGAARLVRAAPHGRGHRGGRGRRLPGRRDRLLRLLDEALKDTGDAGGPDLVAIRAWANQDPQVAEMPPPRGVPEVSSRSGRCGRSPWPPRVTRTPRWMPWPSLFLRTVPGGVTAGAAVLSCGLRVILDQGVDDESVCGRCDRGDRKQLVPRLVAAGHEVHGMTRSESKQAMLHDLGAV